MKYCPKCGFQNAESAIYCARCGNSLASGAGSPTIVVVGNNGSQQVPVGSNPGTIWLWLNIIMTVLSCCANLLGILGIIFGGMAVSKFNNGLYAEAKSNANISKWMFFIGLILGIIGIAVSILLGGLSLIPVIISYIGSFANGGY